MQYYKKTRHNRVQPVCQQNKTLQYQQDTMHHAVASELLSHRDRNICRQTVHQCQLSLSTQVSAAPALHLESHVHVRYLKPTAILERKINHDKPLHSLCYFWKKTNDDPCVRIKLSDHNIHKNQIIAYNNYYGKPSYSSIPVTSQ